MSGEREERRGYEVVYDRDIVGSSFNIRSYKVKHDHRGRAYAEVKIHDGLGPTLWITYATLIVEFLENVKLEEGEELEVDADLFFSQTARVRKDE